MWHEARKREKATQKLFNDHKRRAEKRREENRVDPSSYLQVNGVKARVCLDPNVYKQAVTSMVVWQGDPKIMIDRFDVRTTLESIPRDRNSKSRDKTKQNSRDAGVLDVDESKPMKTLLDYERYRLLIQNDLHGVAEESRLGLVAKSDIISDAKLRKLKGNRFGTSGETSSSFDQTSLSKALVRESTSRRVPAGPTYNSVPPPSSLSTSQNITQLRPTWRDERNTEPINIPSLANEVIDLDEYDNFDLDQVDIKEDSKHIGDVAKKYGLSNAELILLSKLDNKEASLKESIGELKVLIKKTQIHKDSEEVYGPALPPELANAHKKSAATSLEESSSDESSSDSPVPQRSPSGTNMVPLRNGSNDVSNEDSCDNEPSIEKPKAEPHPVTAGVIQPEIVNIASPVERPPMNEGTETQNAKSKEPEVRRRASTPLAYKRNRRSSRSLSRERRSKDHHVRRRVSSSSSSRSSSPSQTRQHYQSRSLSSSSRMHHREDRSRKRARDR